MGARHPVVLLIAIVSVAWISPAAAAVSPHAPATAADHTCYERSGRIGCVRGKPTGAAGAERPLILFLNGYGGDGSEDVLGLGAQAEHGGVLYAFADGKPDKNGRNTWVTIDDSANGVREHAATDVEFIDWLLDRIAAEWNVDRARVFLAGWSLGGFMALRFACARPERVAAVVSYAGSMWTGEESCKPELPVSVLLLHGARDDTVSVEGGVGRRIPLRYASADSVFKTWATLDGCQRIRARSTGLPGSGFGGMVAATRATQCKLDTRVELWKIEGGKHRPNLTAAGTRAISKFLLRYHRRHRATIR